MYYYNILSRPQISRQPNLSFDTLLTQPTPTITQFHKCIQIETISEDYRRRTADLAELFPDVLRLAKPDMSEYYTVFQIPKHSGGYRTIHAPTELLKSYMRNILGYCSNHILMHEAAYAYTKERNAKKALEKHQKAGFSHFLRLDFHDFFGSINPTFLKEQLLKHPFFAIQNPTWLDEFIKLCILHNGLPQGTPLSPFLTNVIMIPIDHAIDTFVHEHHGCYTRYADDILISTTSANACRHMKRGVLEAIAGTPLQLNHDKTRITSINGKNFNLGLMLNKDHEITVGHKRKEICRAKLTDFAHNWVTFPKNEAEELQGILNYYIQIEPQYFQALLTKYGIKYNIDIRATLKSIIATP